jgi:hypothetical protein
LTPAPLCFHRSLALAIAAVSDDDATSLHSPGHHLQIESERSISVNSCAGIA